MNTYAKINSPQKLWPVDCKVTKGATSMGNKLWFVGDWWGEGVILISALVDNKSLENQ